MKKRFGKLESGFLALALGWCLASTGAGGPALAQDDLDFLLNDRESESSGEESSDREPARKRTEERGGEGKTSSMEPEPAAQAEASAVTADRPERERAASLPEATGASPTTPRRRVIEEIVVTAQKREQTLREVPISLSVLDDQFMKEQGITDFRDVSLHVPNAVIDNNGQFNDVRIRGFGSPLSNKAFEQSVGLVINGVPYGRREYFVGPLYDIDRVEVLRGPQGTLFGKNTTAGLFNVSIKRPTDEYTGYLVGELGELDRRRLEAGVGGPVIPGLLNFRVSGLKDERDGLVRNTTARTLATALPRGNARDREGVRFQLGLPNLFGGELFVSYDHVDVDIIGGSWEFAVVNPDHKDFYRQYDPNVDFEPFNWVGSQDTNSLPFQEIDLLTANGSWDLFGWGIDVVGGWAFMEAGFRQSDADFTPAPMFIVNDHDENPQMTFEIRGIAPLFSGLFGLEELFGFPLGNTDLTTGFFFQRREINNSAQAIQLNVPVLAQFLAFQGAPAEEVPPLGDFIGQDVVLGDLGVVNNAAPEETTGFFEQSGNSFAGFGQMDWHFLDRWTLQYGMRLTHETKEATNRRETTEGSGAAFSLLGIRPFEASLSRSEFAFTPKVALQWDWTDDIGVFASWGKGFKSGGFNELASNDDDLSNLEFEPERTTSWELGSKMRLLGGAADLNMALYRQTAENLQVFTVQPSTAIVSVTNAGEALSQGVEVDSTWLPTEWLTLRGTLAFTDAEFLDFPLGTCTGDSPDTDGDGDPRCDLTGEPLFRTPKWTSTLSSMVRVPFESLPGLGAFAPGALSGIDLVGGLTGEYLDTHFVDRTFDPRTRQPSFFRFDGSLGFGNLGQGWDFRVTAENLTNKATVVQRREVTLSAGYVPGEGDFVQILEPQRLIYGSFRWVF